MITEVRVESVDDFRAVIGRLDMRIGVGARWLFRGQSDAGWGLEPSLTRIVRRLNVSRENADRSEMSLAGLFQARAAVLLPPAMVPFVSNAPRLWAIMQHFNAPTRLLDWTQSPYVAAYFAAEQLTSTDAAVWALRSTIFSRAGWPIIPTGASRAVEEWLRIPPPDRLSVVPVQFQMDRMAAQQTYFTISPNILADHADLVDSLAADLTKDSWFKIIIPSDRKLDFLDTLRLMNVHAAALFPGLDGLGRFFRELAWEEMSQVRPPAT